MSGTPSPHSTETSRRLSCSNRAISASKRLQSIFAAVRMWGASVPHGLCGAGRACLPCSSASIAWLWRQRCRLRAQGRRAYARAACSRRRMCSTTISIVLAVAIAFISRGTDCARLSRLRDQPACRGLDRAAAVARHRRGDRHPARAVASRWPCMGCVLRRAALDSASHRSARSASRKRDPNCSDVLMEFSARVQCGRGFRLFPFRGPCDASASASLFSRVAA